MKKRIVVGICLIIVATLLIIYRELRIKEDQNMLTNIYSITNSGAKAENVGVYLNASYVGGSLANYKNNDKESFFVVFGDEVQYIVYMKNSFAKEINDYLLDNPNSTKKIVGKTKIISSDMEEYGKDFIKNWLDTNHDHSNIIENHSHEISNEEFYQYFGYVYLEVEESPYEKYIVLNIIMYTFLIGGLLLIISACYQKIF